MERKKKLKRGSRWGIALLALAVALALYAPYYVIYHTSLSFGNGNPTGDTIGGIAGPLINLIAAILVYMSFQAQFRANQILQSELEENKAKSQMELVLTLFKEIEAELRDDDNIANRKKVIKTIKTIKSAQNFKWLNVDVVLFKDFHYIISRVYYAIDLLNKNRDLFSDEQMLYLARTIALPYDLFLKEDMDSLAELPKITNENVSELPDNVGEEIKNYLIKIDLIAPLVAEVANPLAYSLLIITVGEIELEIFGKRVKLKPDPSARIINNPNENS